MMKKFKVPSALTMRCRRCNAPLQPINPRVEKNSNLKFFFWGCAISSMVFGVSFIAGIIVSLVKQNFSNNKTWVIATLCISAVLALVAWGFKIWYNKSKRKVKQVYCENCDQKIDFPNGLI